jgi:hypothetical protein
MDDGKLRREILQGVKPLIDRIFTTLEGAGVGSAAYALLTSAVTVWRRTGLSDSALHETIDGILDQADVIEAARQAGKN